MPNIKAATKWARQTAKRRVHNLDVKSRLKTIYKTAVSANDLQTVRSVEGEFDRAARKGIIHPNKAARKKSRLAKAAGKFLSAAPARKKTTRARKTTSKKKAAK